MKEHQPKDQTSELQAQKNFIEININHAEHSKKSFEENSKIENECNNDYRRLCKETLILIASSATTEVSAPVMS